MVKSTLTARIFTSPLRQIHGKRQWRSTTYAKGGSPINPTETQHHALRAALFITQKAVVNAGGARMTHNNRLQSDPQKRRGFRVIFIPGAPLLRAPEPSRYMFKKSIACNWPT
jgi:hypothetical protein